MPQQFTKLLPSNPLLSAGTREQLVNGTESHEHQAEPDMQPSRDTHTSLCWRWLPGKGDTFILGDGFQTMAQLPADPVSVLP